MKDSNLYWKENNDYLMIFVIYVDDIISISNDEESKKFVEEIRK